MIFLTDTCFWTHIHRLFSEFQIDLRPLLEQFNWGLSKNIINELKNLQIDEWIPIELAYTIPFSKNEYQKAIKHYPFIQDLDMADQELLLIALRDNLPVITDDCELASTSVALGIYTLRLPDFIISLLKSGDIDKHLFNRIFRAFEEQKRYKLKELKNWKKPNL